jgi:hypothetical protein
MAKGHWEASHHGPTRAGGAARGRPLTKKKKKHFLCYEF